jgi:hypothetical protein
MPLTFRSTGKVEKVLIDRASDGRQRVCKATQSDYNERHWTLHYEVPSGRTKAGTFTGDENTVYVAMAQLMMDNNNNYRDDLARGDRPREPGFDRNRSVSAAVSPITPIYGRGG